MKNKLFKKFILALCLTTLIFPMPFIAKANELTISAAASLTDVFNELATNFSQETGTKIHTNYGGSGALLRQIEAGAPVDIFASADQATMQKAEDASLIIKESRNDFAENSVVLIVPKNTKNAIPKEAEYLLKSEYKAIVLAQSPSVPIGRYAKQSLEHANVLEKIQDRVIYAEHVRAILAYVVRGEVDAGIVYKTDAMSQKDKIIEACTLGGHDPVTYPIAIIANSPAKENAQQFIDYLKSDAGQTILKKHGFLIPYSSLS